MGGTGATQAHAMRATKVQRDSRDQARLDDLQRLADGKVSRRKKSAVFTAVAEYNNGAAREALSLSLGPEKRKHGSPHKSAGRQKKKAADSGVEIWDLPVPTNELEYTPASALKTMMTYAPTAKDKPGPVIAAMQDMNYVPVGYKTLTSLRNRKLKDNTFKAQ
jgi:hypothetical protein